jgi:hypothetical protein
MAAMNLEMKSIEKLNGLLLSLSDIPIGLGHKNCDSSKTQNTKHKTLNAKH